MDCHCCYGKFILKFDFVLSFQVSVYGVPYALAALGKAWAESLPADRLTEMYRAAVKKEELDRTGAETVDARIQDNPRGFRVVRAAFGSTVVNYASQNRGVVANILHFVFSTPRGSGTIPAELSKRIDALHAILGLAKGAVLLNIDHPAIQECPPEEDGGLPRVFPLQGKDGKQTIHRHGVAGSAQNLFFTKALGGVHL